MSEKLMRYIQYAQEQGGLPGKVQLAQFTKMPSARAAMEPDSPENIQLFRDGLKKIFLKDPPSF